MQFLFQPLTWGFLLVGVPILVHLINMLRHRRVKWAAMDFLLESYRRNRRWVMLKQWLLLAARILAMLLLVAMLAGWVSNSQWLSWFGQQTTHHYVLLDDSLSMAERSGDESAYGRALQALNGLVRSVASRPGQHQLTLIRWSRASLATPASRQPSSRADGSTNNDTSNNDTSGPTVDSVADLSGQTVPRDPGRLLDRLNATRPTSLQLSPDAALELVSPAVANSAGERAEVYLITDLRRNEFAEPELLKTKLQTLAQNDAGLHIIDCGEDGGANLTVAAMEPEQEVWAAGVPLMVRFQVRNPSDRVFKNVVVRVSTISYPQGSVTPRSEEPYSGAKVELPPVVIEQIQPGETVTRQVQVIFGTPGDHAVAVELPDDALVNDNRRWCVIGVRQAQRVLLVDGDVDQANAFYFETVISPDSRLRTGMEFQKADAAFLRDVEPATLGTFDVVAMLDVPRLDDQAIDKLEQFCSAGGGLLWVAGPNTNVGFVNDRLYRQGSGLYPLEIESIVETELRPGNQEPQVAASEHPILAPLRQLSASPFLLLRISQYLRATDASAAASAVKLVAAGPGGDPLVVDRSFGEGHVVAVLTGLTGEWSNWAQDPTFVILALRSLGYLGSFRHEPSSFPVSSPLEMVVADEAMLPEGEILFPVREQAPRMRLQHPVSISDGGKLSRLSLAVNSDQLDREVIDGLLREGVFETWMMSADGQPRVRAIAHNVPAIEGDLSRVSRTELDRKLAGLEVDIKNAETVSRAGLQVQRGAQSGFLLACLALLLLGEQWLAYSASYHAPMLQGARR